MTKYIAIKDEDWEEVCGTPDGIELPSALEDAILLAAWKEQGHIENPIYRMCYTDDKHPNYKLGYCNDCPDEFLCKRQAVLTKEQLYEIRNAMRTKSD